MAQTYTAVFHLLGNIAPPSFLPNARIIARYRKPGLITGYETTSEIVDGYLRVTAEAPSAEIAMDLDIGWFSENCFLPIVADDQIWIAA